MMTHNILGCVNLLSKYNCHISSALNTCIYRSAIAQMLPMPRIKGPFATGLTKHTKTMMWNWYPHKVAY